MKELSPQHRLPVGVYAVEEATAFLADGDRATCLLKHCHSCMHKLISCDGTASAETDGDKFGITMLGRMSSVCIALHSFEISLRQLPGGSRGFGIHSVVVSVIPQRALAGVRSESLRVTPSSSKHSCSSSQGPGMSKSH